MVVWSINLTIDPDISEWVYVRSSGIATTIGKFVFVSLPPYNAPMSLTVALLMFNEALSISSVLDETLSFCSRAFEDFEIIVVDDGSTDGSAEIVRRRMEREPRVRLVEHSANRGMGAGVRSALQAARSSHFVFNAADGQIPAAELGRMLPLLARADGVLSTYANRRPLGRRLLSRGLRAYLRFVAGLRFSLEGLYIVPTGVAREVASGILFDTFLFSFALIDGCKRRGVTFDTCEITCRPRLEGRSKVLRPGRMAKIGREALQFGVGRRVRNLTRPHSEIQRGK